MFHSSWLGQIDGGGIEEVSDQPDWSDESDGSDTSDGLALTGQNVK